MRYGYWAGIGASIILGLILIVAGLGKLPNQAEFLATILSKSFLTPLLAHLVGLCLPAIEVLLGSLLILGIATKIMASLSAVLIMGFIAHNSWVITHGLGHEPCSCLGILERLFQGEFSTTEALYLDIGMLALVLIILLSYPESFSTIRPWFFKEDRGNEDT